MGKRFRQRFMIGISTAALAMALLWWIKWQEQKNKQTESMKAIELPPHPETKVEKTAPPPEPAKPYEPKAAPADQPDDLKQIEGIGPKTASVLGTAGVRSFAQLASLTVDELTSLLRENNLRSNPETWPEQARLATAGEWEALAALQDSLVAGRRT